MTQTLNAAHLTPIQLDAFVDAELPPNECEVVEQHLVECHRCALRVIEKTRLKLATVNAARQFTIPPDALARLQGQLHPQQPSKKSATVYSFRASRWVALAACLLLAVVLVGMWRFRQSNTESAELLDQHLAVLSSAATPQVISTDRHTVKPWFQGKLPFSFNLPETLPPDTVLKGADLTYLDGQPAAMLLFTVHKHEASVFLTQRSNRTTAIERPGTRSGFAIHYATTRELRIAAVSNVDPQQLDLLIAAIVQAQ
jgi:anti-sigma factor RsiW